jgi:transposase-like protein
MMIDAVGVTAVSTLVAIGITTEGRNIALALWKGSTENATVPTALLSNFVETRAGPRIRDRVRH